MTQSLPEALNQRGIDPAHTAEHLLYLIEGAISNHPRSLQRAIGPSEIGHPCARRIGYKLLGKGERAAEPNWRATVGTALHAWLEGVMDAANTDYEARTRSGQERFLIEQRVSVGEILDTEITGSCDVYDRVTATVIDWKTVGPTQLAKYKRLGPGNQYRCQAHLYGRGWQRQGMPVDQVMIVFLPRNGELAETFVWWEPYDEAVAVNALQRATGIQLAVNALGSGALHHLDTHDAWCHTCPFFLAHSTVLSAGCPGDPSRTVRRDSIESLIA